MKNLVKQILIKTHLMEYIPKVSERLLIMKRKVRGVDRSIIESYFAKQEVRKLHLGCGKHSMKGWLNSDFRAISNNVLQLDVTKRFPFKNDTLDYIYSEHMIEHITYSDAMLMLSECFRVLKPNGKIRISTPDLQFLIDLYQQNKTQQQIEYIKYDTNRFIKWAPYPDDTFVINNFVRDWHHTFIYDEKTLRSSFQCVGFSNIVRCVLNESESEAFQNLENEKRHPPGFLKLQTFTLEGTK